MSTPDSDPTRFYEAVPITLDWPHWATPGHDMELCPTNNMTRQETYVCWVMGSYPVMKKVNGEQGFAVMDSTWCEQGKGVEMHAPIERLC